MLPMFGRGLFVRWCMGYLTWAPPSPGKLSLVYRFKFWISLKKKPQNIPFCDIRCLTMDRVVIGQSHRSWIASSWNWQIVHLVLPDLWQRWLGFYTSVALSLSLSSVIPTPLPPPPSTALISWSPSALFIPCLQDWFHTVIPSLKRQTSQQLTSKADLKYLRPSPFSFLIGSNRFLTGREKKVDWISPHSAFRLCPSLPPSRAKYHSRDWHTACCLSLGWKGIAMLGHVPVYKY